QADFRGFCAAPAGTPLDAKTVAGRQKPEDRPRLERGDKTESGIRKAEKGKAGSWKLAALFGRPIMNVHSTRSRWTIAAALTGAAALVVAGCNRDLTDARIQTANGAGMVVGCAPNQQTIV